MSLESLKKCRVCPRNCHVDRTEGQLGFCRTGDAISLAWSGLHFGEEPCFSGTRGVANFFFSGCSLACVYCQNFQISQGSPSIQKLRPGEFADECLKFQEKKAHFIGLVSPGHQVPQIREGLVLAKEKGLKLPVIYNSSAYDSLNSLKSLEGLIDIYLPDIKYADDACALKYSGVREYRKISQSAVTEMYRQVGDIKISKKTGLAEKGLWVRHLVLPENIAGAYEVLCFLALEISTGVGLSIMSQYSPVFKAKNYPEICRLITEDEYDIALNIAESLGFSHILGQDPYESPDNARPDFDREKPFEKF